ncbi:lytic transglycosylase domain-containing protein [Microbacterium sp. bgisy189]|uniref:aggregation-promoting factor C-terminal-like domain-containing protein n=1 Tax=Microbacterium sp. bgisy189 TaxID=3413798 RepID=UPI003EBB074F
MNTLETHEAPTRSSLKARNTHHPLRRLAAGAAVGVVIAGAAAPAYAVAVASAATEAPTFAQAASDVEFALVQAEAAIDDAAAVEAEVKASELDLGAADVTIDVDDLEAAMDELEQHELIPSLMLPEMTEDLLVEVSLTNAASGELAGALDAAEQAEAERLAAAAAKRRAAEAAAKKKAEEEAAAAAAAEAEAAAEAAAAEEAAESSSGGSSLSAGSAASSGDNSVAGAQATARSIASSEYGWGDDQFSCLVDLWNRESGWNYQAYNASSGAYGIPQALPGSKMGSAGADWETSATTQIIWGLGYISSRYDTPCGAWSHSESVGWY